MSFKQIFGVGIFVTVFIVMFATIGINDNGYRTVVQWPNGYTFVKFEPGIYFKLFGKNTVYPDVITHDLEDNGVAVRYQDGGTGTVDGVVRIKMPDVEDTMLVLHRAVREEAGLRSKLIYPEVKQALNLTAGLMTSEEAYAVRRNDYADWASDQVENGRYRTTLQPKKIIINGEEKIREVPTFVTNKDTGQPLHQDSPFEEYGLRVVGFQITDWGFEPATLKQIQDKRQAEMAVITAKANAERARQEKEQVVAEGEKAVELKRYQELEKAQVEIIQRERDVEVAKLEVEKQKQEVLAAAEYKKAQILIGEGDAERKRLIIEADGALSQKLETYEKVNARYAVAIEKQKWVPEILMGGSSSSSGSAAQDIMDMFQVKVAKDLQLDMTIQK